MSSYRQHVMHRNATRDGTRPVPRHQRCPNCAPPQSLSPLERRNTYVGDGGPQDKQLLLNSGTQPRRGQQASVFKMSAKTDASKKDPRELPSKEQGLFKTLMVRVTVSRVALCRGLLP